MNDVAEWGKGMPLFSRREFGQFEFAYCSMCGERIIIAEERVSEDNIYRIFVHFNPSIKPCSENYRPASALEKALCATGK